MRWDLIRIRAHYRLICPPAVVSRSPDWPGYPAQRAAPRTSQWSVDRHGVNMSLVLLLLLGSLTEAIKLSPDGRYSGVTVLVEENVPGERCQVLTDSIKVSQSNVSRASLTRSDF